MQLNNIMNTREGREFIFDLIVYSGFFVEPAHERRAHTEYNLGRESIGREIYTELLKPEHKDVFFKMHSEQGERIAMKKEKEKEDYEELYGVEDE